MNRIKLVLLGCAGFTVAAMTTIAQEVPAAHQEIISRMHVMAQGTYTEAEWSALMNRLDELQAEARTAGQIDNVVELEVLRAKVLSARGRHDAALALMQDTLATYRTQPIPAMKKVYVELAALYARTGDEAAVARIMTAFKDSPHYDGQTYDFSGGTGPGDPLRVPRPSVAVGDSVSMTALNLQRTRSRFAPGALFPPFELTDWSGRSWSNRDLQGRVVLIDFWADTLVWRRDVPYRIGIYQRHQARGFEVLGLSLSPEAATARAAAQAAGIPWPLASAPRPLLKTLGIFGDVANFLVDGNGVIIGRDLYGADLEAAVHQAVTR